MLLTKQHTEAGKLRTVIASLQSGALHMWLMQCHEADTVLA